VNKDPKQFKPLSAELDLPLFSQLRYRIQAAKVWLCLLVAFSALLGFAMASFSLGDGGAAVFVSVLLLACGAASLNSYQEHRSDKQMTRTAGRPLALGLMSPAAARRQGQILAGLGLFLLYLGTASTAAVGVGAAALVIYNGVYTPLKHTTVWAVLPGAVCGAMPPYIGWIGAGGDPFSPVILGVTVMLALWQIPHFWLVLLSYRDDYRHAHLPNMARLVPESSLKYLSIVWVAALIVVLHTLLAIMPTIPAGLRIAMSATGLIFLCGFGLVMTRQRRPNYRILFMILNMFMLYIMALLTVACLVI